MHIQHHEFAPRDFVGGHLAIDFVNTVTARDAEPRDWLDGYDALIRWARHTERFAKKDLARLEELARKEPAKASAALARGGALREALCSVLYAFVAGRAPKDVDLRAIDEARLAAAKSAVLVSTPRRLNAEWTVERSGLDLVTHVVAAQAVELARDPRIDRLRLCAGEQCGWLFLDTSKNGSRRWCDMATCGNVSKVRRFLQRQRATTKAKRKAGSG